MAVSVAISTKVPLWWQQTRRNSKCSNNNMIIIGDWAPLPRPSPLRWRSMERKKNPTEQRGTAYGRGLQHMQQVGKLVHLHCQQLQKEVNDRRSPSKHSNIHSIDDIVKYSRVLECISCMYVCYYLVSCNVNSNRF
jgi:hypothetical protein